MRYEFIVNPVAGNGFALTVMEQIGEEMKKRGIEYHVNQTASPGNATEIARQYADDPEVTAVVSVGGDGTVREVAEGLAGTAKTMGMIPAGTGNDFAKAVGISLKPEEALETLMKGKSRKIDTGEVNDGFFLNVCGTGFDVTVLDWAESYKKKYRGLTPYFLGLLKAIAHYESLQLKITVDGEIHEGRYLVCSIANGTHIGGGIPICPAARPDDGWLDVVMIRHVPRRRIPAYLPGLMRGKDLEFRITEHCRAKEIRISGENLRINIDGEIVSMSEAVFRIHPGALCLVTGNYIDG